MFLCPAAVQVALQRPTVTLSFPPACWCYSLRKLSLAGNPLGDQASKLPRTLPCALILPWSFPDPIPILS